MGHQPSSPRRRRGPWKRLGAWWRRRRKNYHVVADAPDDPAIEAMRQLMHPSESTETPDGEEIIFEVIAEAVPEGAPSKDLPRTIQAVAAYPQPFLPPAISESLPLLHPRKVPSTVPALTRQPSLSVPDPFMRRRTKDSFQGSLESIDSLIESYWDPEGDASLATPVATNFVQGFDFLEEHVDFLKVQTQPRSVEVVWETQDRWDVDSFLS